MENKLNIYQKMILAKHDILNSKMKKSGKNNFAGYDYFELDDIMPEINKIEINHKLLTSISFSNEYGVLTVINAENPSETITYTCPMAEAQIKGCQPVQNLGGTTTYIRRYLYSIAFDISEHDALDRITGKDSAPQQQYKPAPVSKPITPPVATAKAIRISDDQKKHILSFAKDENSATNIRNVLKKFGYSKVEEIETKDYEAFLELVDDAKLPFTLA